MVEKVNEQATKLLTQVANFDLPYAERMAAAQDLKTIQTGQHDGSCTFKTREDGCLSYSKISEYEFKDAPIDPNAFILSNDEYFEKGAVDRARKDITAESATFQQIFAKSGYTTHCRIDDDLLGRYRNHLICRNEVYVPTPKYPDTGFHCFPAETLLLKEDGNTISMGEYAAIWAVDPSAVPEIATYDENGSLLYRKPTEVFDHGITQSTLLYLGLEDENTNITPLRVTSNHPLLVDRGGEMDWVDAGDLIDGDLIVGPAGEYRYDEETTMSVEGAFALYNFEFEGPHTYLVSPDGANWIVAHNKYL